MNRFFPALIVSFSLLGHALGQQQFQGVCARVKIEILQELTLERVGFLATLELTDNDGTDAITDFFAALTFENGMLSTPQKINDASALFFVRAPEMENIADVGGGGVIGPTKTATIRWFIIPKVAAGGTNAVGINYRVGAKLSGRMRGVELPAEYMAVVPDTITVKPDPQLDITYFQPRDVQGDDPFTDNVESPIPFTLGVLVRNSGYGLARRLKIDSQQPRIVENKRNLLLIAQLLGARVMDSPLQSASLLIDLGDIPPAGARKGAWDMITSLSGEFVEFKASYTHASELGGEETSLIKSLQAYFIAHEVLNDQPGRDPVRDFLADTDRDERMIPDALYESEGNVLPVNFLAGVEPDPTALSDGTYQINLKADRKGWGYIRLNDPGQGKRHIASLLRSDGKRINSHNVWLNTRYERGTNARFDYLNLFDLVDLGDYQYNVTYATEGADNLPPLTALHFSGEFAAVNDKFFITPETQMYFISEDDSPVSIFYSLDGRPFLPAYPFRVRESGEHALVFYAEDSAKNRETNHTAILVVGAQAPVLARFDLTDQPLIVAGNALSVRPAKADLVFQVQPNVTRVDAQIDVYQGVRAWPALAGTPSSPTSSRTANLSVAGEFVDFYKFRFDTGEWSAEQASSQPIVLTGLSEGPHSVRLLARASAGTYAAESNAVDVAWIVLSNAPPTLISNAPPTPTRLTDAQLAVAGAGVTLYRWTVNDGYYRPETPTATPLTLSNLPPGRLNLAVLGKINDAWQETNRPTSVVWVVDPAYGSDYSSMPLVRSLTLTNVSDSVQTFSWDGRNESGVVLAPGYYTIKLTLRDQVGRSNFQTRLVRIGDLAGAAGIVADPSRGPKNPHGRGRWVVWQDQTAGNWNIYAQDLRTTAPSIVQISQSAVSQENPKTDGRYAVWQARQPNGGWDVWYNDLLDPSRPKPVTATPDWDEINPAVEWPWVVYQARPASDPRAPWMIHAQNLATTQHVVIWPGPQDQLDPDIQSGRVVWQDYRDVGPGEIYFKNLDTGEQRRLTTSPYGQYHPVLYDQWVVWQDNRNGQVDLFGFDLLANREITLTSTAENETRPFLDGPWCLCEEDSLGTTSANLRLVHLPSLAAVPVTRTDSMKARPALVAHHAVWQETMNNRTQIRFVELPALQSVFEDNNAVAVTPTLAANHLNAHNLLRLWQAQAGVSALTRFSALLPAVAVETARWENGLPAGPNFPLVPGTFIWVKFNAAHVLDLGADPAQLVNLVPGVNVLQYTRFPPAYSSFKLLRQLGVGHARAVRMLESESGRWRVAEVRNQELVGHDFMIPGVAVLLLEMQTGVNQWRPE